MSPKNTLTKNIREFFGKDDKSKKIIIVLRKILSLGDVGMCYLIWYGLTRVVMEPLRSGGYEYSQSFITAIVMMGAGALGILAFHIYDLIRKKKGLKPRTLETIFKNEEEETDSL